MKVVALGFLLLSSYTCGYSHHDHHHDDEDDQHHHHGFVIVSTTQLAPDLLVPAFRVDLDGDGRLDLATPDRWLLHRDDGWEETPAGDLPAGSAAEPQLAMLQDLDIDGRIDRIYLDGILFWDRDS